MSHFPIIPVPPAGPYTPHADRDELIKILMGMMDPSWQGRSSRYRSALDIMMPLEDIPALREEFLSKQMSAADVRRVLDAYRKFFLRSGELSFSDLGMYTEAPMTSHTHNAITQELSNPTQNTSMESVFSRDVAAVAYSVVSVAPRLCMGIVKFQMFLSFMVCEYHRRLSVQAPHAGEATSPATEHLSYAILTQNTHFFWGILLPRLALCHYLNAQKDGRILGDVNTEDWTSFIENLIIARVFVKSMPTAKHPHSKPRICPAHTQFRMAARAEVGDMWRGAAGIWRIDNHSVQDEALILPEIGEIFTDVVERYFSDVMVELPGSSTKGYRPPSLPSRRIPS